jgi:hypothetical protein
VNTTFTESSIHRVYYSIIVSYPVIVQPNEIILKKQRTVPITGTSSTSTMYQVFHKLGITSGSLQTTSLNTSFSEVLVTKQWSSSFIDTLPLTAIVLESIGSYRNLEKTRYNLPRIYLIL